VLFSALMFLSMACGPETTSEKTCEPACDAWKTCNTDTGKCELKDTYCENVDGKAVGCEEGQICNSGYKCEDNACGTVTCDGFGTCELDAGSPVCTCNDGYELSSDKKHCTLSAKCSAANLTGTCDDACNACNNGVCEPDGSGYLCEGKFNHKCDPSKEGAQGEPHPDCTSDYPYCITDPDDETVGYCTYTGCKNDTECNDANYTGRSADKFYCWSFGYTVVDNQGKIGDPKMGLCEKVSSTCTAVTDDKANYAECGDPCGSSECAGGAWCMGGFCIPTCDPADANSCGDGKACKNVNTDDFPLYRCVTPCGNDGECATSETGNACNSFGLGKELGQDAITTNCGKADGAVDDGGECVPGDDATFEQSCIDGLCLASQGATTGTCSAVCDSSDACGDDRFCFAYSPFFSDTDAALPICVDSSIFTDLVYAGKCSQEGGCTGETRCTPQAVASVVMEDSDIEYLCLGSSQALTGAEFGEACTPTDTTSGCKSGYCKVEDGATEGVCNAFCDVDANCPDTHECKPAIRYYTDAVANDTQYKICVEKALK